MGKEGVVLFAASRNLLAAAPCPPAEEQSVPSHTAPDVKTSDSETRQ